MEKKIREKTALLEVLTRVEDALANSESWARDARDAADLTPDEDGNVKRWEQQQYDEAVAKLAAIETVRAALGKLI